MTVNERWPPAQLRLCSAPPPPYERHRPEQTPLYALVEEHFPRFLERLDAEGVSLPHFVIEEFEAYLKCGRLEYGFLRVKCDACCRHEKLVAFSCKRRGFCPSCGARRMAETAAHLVEHVLPEQPIRQWVLSFPFPLRFLLATRPAVLTQVLGIVYRAVSTFLVRRAGLRVGAGARTGAVTLIQRFGSALNLNPHLHMLFLDGVYTFDDESPRFHRIAAPTQAELQRLLHAIATRVIRALERQGLLSRDEETPALDIESDDGFEQLLGAAVHYRIATRPPRRAQGPDAAHRRLQPAARQPLHRPALGILPPSPPRMAQSGVGTACEARDRDSLERLCRYIARPPVSNERLSVNDRGQVVYRLKHPFSDGTTHVVLDPIDFIARLAALIPRPRAHLIRYHGVFAPNFNHRHRIIPNPVHQSAREPQPSRHAPMRWMQRLKRVFHIDIEHCGMCGGTLRVIACIETPLKCRSLRELAHSSTRSSPISPPATPSASTAPAHRRSSPRKPNSRPPLLRPCPECARGCTTAPLRLASRALRSPVPS